MPELRYPALAYSQGPDRTLYTFAADGVDLSQFVTVSRIARDNGGPVRGYQRPEVLSHIAAIRAYLTSERPMMPNALVVAFDGRVWFEAASESADQEKETLSAKHGTLVIPVDPADADHKKPGWVVDGQQRIAALRDATRKGFHVCIVAFVADNLQEQREQFILVNATKPLPKGLIYELLPQTGCTLPTLLQKRRFPAYLMERLNYQPDSPFYHRIKTPTNPDGYIQDNSVLQMIENSLYDGALYTFRERGNASLDDEGNAEAMLEVMSNYWHSVTEVFPKAWDLPPRRSRLTHGAGIVAMGYIMDAITDRLRGDRIPSRDAFRSDLEQLEPVCRWTHGYWEFGPGAQRRWNEIQNTSTDIRLLTNYLVIQYKQLVWSNALRQPNIRA